MSGEWAARRFWTRTEIRGQEDAWFVELDGRSVRTPARRPFAMPSHSMAEAVAAEWQAQDKVVDPKTMPVTRAVNAAIDKVAPQHADVADAIAAYAETDLLCYRAESPDTLTRRQAEAWDPLLDWAGEAFDARLAAVGGVMPQPQDSASLSRLSDRVHRLDPFSLTALHDLVMLSGSLILGFAVTHERLTAEEAWDLSRIDEDWQAEFWGRDAEAEQTAMIRRDAFLAAERFERLSRR